MLPTFVIGLREGLEAALIVGIIAAFLGKMGERKALRQVWLGVGLAVLICLCFGIALKLISEDLPQKQQETLQAFMNDMKKRAQGARALTVKADAVPANRG